MLKDELEKRIFNAEGRLKLDTSLKDFAEYIGYRSRENKEGLSFSAYLRLRRFNDLTIRDLEKIRPYGLKRLMIIGIGEKKAEEFNKLLSKYGVKPIPWTTKRYESWELKKELQGKYGKHIWTVGDILRKD